MTCNSWKRCWEGPFPGKNFTKLEAADRLLRAATNLPVRSFRESHSPSSNVNMLLPAAIAITCFPWL